jgi:hypothetical protein
MQTNIFQKYTTRDLNGGNGCDNDRVGVTLHTPKVSRNDNNHLDQNYDCIA